MSSEAKPAWPLVVGLTALAYVVVGWLALRLAVAPGHAAPLYPSAGIAFACAWVYGRPAVLAAVIGGFVMSLVANSARNPVDLSALAMAAVVGIGAALQAQLGCWLTRHKVAQPLTLARARDVWCFLLLAGPLACLVNASMSVGMLGIMGTVSRGDLAVAWSTWWVGDTLGVLIAAPAVLSLLARPRTDWAPRRMTVALPLVVATLLLVAATVAVNRWDDQRLHAAFERDANRAADSVEAWLQSPLQALQAVHSTLDVQPQVNADGLRRAAAWWLDQPLHLQAIGWAEHVDRDNLAAFEATVRAEGQVGFRVFDRPAPGSLATGDAAVVAVRFVEPLTRNAAALGVNSMSVPAAATAIERSRRSGKPSASAGFRLTQETGEQIGVVIYQALYRQPVDSATQRQAGFRGVGFVTLRMDEAMAALMAKAPQGLRWCLMESADGSTLSRLAGPVDCVHASGQGYRLERVLDFAGQHWTLRLGADAARPDANTNANAGLMSAFGLFAAALLGALLLIVSGRARRIELAVDNRTAALRHEVTQRQRTEEALRASEQQLQAILDSAQVGIVKTDLHGQVLKPNPAYCRLLGYSERALVQLQAGAITHPDDRNQDAALLAAMVRGEHDVYRVEKRYLRQGGAVLHVRLTVALLRNAAGQPESTVGVVEDIGEHLRLAEAERARDAAESSNRAKSEFVSRMSHELRTPLNAMLGFAQLLGLDRKPPLVEHQRAWASQIQQAGWHLLHMINDTLDLSRIESGALVLEPMSLEVQTLLQSALAMVQPAAAKRSLQIDQDMDPRASSVMGDETRIKQILTNLLSNAIKYNVEGGRITVKARPGEAQTIELVVSDTGLGMTRGQMDGLFQPYNRLGRERSTVEGTGIGLVISRKLAELMGGSLRAQSVAGEGSTFILTLPRASFRNTDLSTGGELPAETAEYRQRLVHYVEDNETNVEVMRGMLLRRPQVRLTVSSSGLDALAAMRQRRPSLILLDMHLPDIDGMELLRYLKDDDELGNIPVVVVSADATTPRVEGALTAGAAHYVTKPVNLAAFLAILDELLDDLETHFG